jgi:hypothetical protein
MGLALSTLPNGIFMITSLGGIIFSIIYDGQGEEKAKQTINLISFFDPAAQFLAIFIVPRFSRRLLLILGYTLVALINIAVGITDWKNSDMAVLILAISLAVVTSIFQEPVQSLYLTEVSNNAVSGLVALINNIAVLGYSSSISYLIREVVGPQVMFYIQGGLTGLAALFIMTFIKETSHLTDK